MAGAFILGNGFTFALPTANATTIAGIIGVDVGHCTYRFSCETQVCGDHICNAGELNTKGQYVTQATPVVLSSGNAVRSNTILTMQAIAIYPPDGAILKNFPTSLQVQVTRGGYPVDGATVQFWFGEHNAFLTTTDSSGFAYLTLLNQNTLDAGYYGWHATAIKPGFKGGTTSSRTFIISSGNSMGLSSGGTVSTDQTEYAIKPGNDLSVKISGHAYGYYIGDAIILKIISPDGKSTQLVARGTYLGAFQSVYTSNNSEAGVYTVTAFYKYGVFSTATFNVVKLGS